MAKRRGDYFANSDKRATISNTDSMTVARSNTILRQPERIPPLQPGDHLTRDEFERRYDATPNIQKAELIEGVVYMPPPVSQDEHGGQQFDLIGWLGIYRAMTPGIRGGDNSTLRLDLDNEPQPDAFLYVLPSHGGQVRMSGGYVEGGPEFVAEVAASSVSYDLHSKKRVYLRNNGREYLVWRVLDEAIDWFILQDGHYTAMQADAQGLYHSPTLPGLCLDAAALIRGDLATVMRRQQEALNDPRHAEFVARLADFAARHSST